MRTTYRHPLHLALCRKMITTGKMLGRPVIPNRHSTRPPFQPELIARIVGQPA